MAIFRYVLTRLNDPMTIMNEYDVQAELIKNGFCPYHPDMLLRKKNLFGVWTTLRDSCPRCDHNRINTKGSTASSIASTIATTLSEMKMNELNADIQKEGLLELAQLATSCRLLKKEVSL